MLHVGGLARGEIFHFDDDVGADGVDGSNLRFKIPTDTCHRSHPRARPKSHGW